MAEETPDITLPINPRQIGRAVDAIVEKALPAPLGELCMPVGQMRRELTAYAGELVQAAYNDSIAPDARVRLARWLYLQAHLTDPGAAHRWDNGAHERGPWLRQADLALAVITGTEK